MDQEISSEIPYNGKYICNLLVFVTTRKKKNEQKRELSVRWNILISISRNFHCINAIGRAFTRISGKEDNLTKYTQIFGNSSLVISVPFNYPSKISRIFGLIVPFMEIQQFPAFLPTFPGSFATICPRFKIFRNFG